MPSDRFDVLYFGAVDWSHTWQRPQQIASRLAAQGRVVYVDPIGLRRARLSDAPRMVRRLRGAAFETRSAAGGVTVISARAATLASSLCAPVPWQARLLGSWDPHALERARF